MMPGLDGFEVAKRLKADDRTARIPILFMTGLIETEYLVATLNSGGVDEPPRLSCESAEHGARRLACARVRASPCVKGYNSSFGKASAFYIEAPGNRLPSQLRRFPEPEFTVFSAPLQR